MGRITGAGLFFILINIIFLVAGVMLISFTNSLQDTGWVDALSGTEYNDKIILVSNVMMYFGYGVIILSMIGIAGAITTNPALLVVYAIFMALCIGIFGVFAGTSFSVKGKFKNWSDTQFPADESENKLAIRFNEAYCYAQGAYYCNTAKSHEAIDVFVPGIPSAIKSLLPDEEGINGLCDAYLSTIPGMQPACNACSKAREFEKYDKVLAWADSKCPRTAATQTWCGSFLVTGEPGNVFVNSPYEQCRGRFLDLVIDWCGKLALGGVVAAVVAAALLALSCFSRKTGKSRRKKQREREERESENNGYNYA